MNAPTPAMRRLLPLLAATLLAAALSLAGPARADDDAASAPASGAAALRARYDALHDQLAHNAFGRPLVLDSTQSGDRLEGRITARLDQPFAAVQQALQGTRHWCSILILHLNVKMCHVQPAGLDLALGRKYDQPVDDAYKLHFDYRLDASTPDYLRATLSAPDGPLGTKDYRIVVEATPLDAGHTVLYMSYAYGFGLAARMAMGTYLSTIGADKVGFSTEGKDGAFVGGVRGLVERNTMRYYLAIEDYVAAPGPERLDQRLNAWFDATERWPRQLHELDKSDYLAMKRAEAKR
ncbi:MAG TPA: hypothetical protein VF453_16160 [Burkholderiaceae bacterium]